MLIAKRRLRADLRGDHESSRLGGFTMIEVLVAGFILIVGLIAMSGFFSSALGRVADSKTRSIMAQVAQQELEKIRALKYADVGLVNSMPGGTLLAHETTTTQGINLTIDREITFFTDPSNTSPYPANYRRVTIRVGAPSSHLDAVVVSTNVAGGAAGGSLDIFVHRLDGTPVADALIVVTNTHLSPNLLIDSPAIKTDSDGRLLIPGLTPDATASYSVTANKAGYNSATYPPQVVNDGMPYTAIDLTIEPLSTMIVHTRLVDGTAVPDRPITVTGGASQSYSWSGQTGNDGSVTLSNIWYSTSLMPYVIRLATSPDYTAPPLSVTLAGGETQEETLVLTPVATTTTTVPSTTTTVGGTTTTTVATTTTTGRGSLAVHVHGTDNHSLKGAVVLFNGINQRTDSSGNTTFSNVPFGTYTLTVTYGGNVHQETIEVNGNETVTVSFAT